MTMSEAKLLETVEDLTKRKWEKDSQPLLLSHMGTELASKDIDYKSILGDTPIGKFISDKSKQIKVIKHPTQHAKIGVIPSDENYEFSTPQETQDAEHTETEKGKAQDLKRSRRAFYNFISEVSRLPSEDIDSIVIPTRVVVKLLEGKK